MGDETTVGGSWVRQSPKSIHRCAPPQGSFGLPVGDQDDLWRCGCGALWRIGLACAACEFYGYGNHRGVHDVGNAWRPATRWQRFTTWLRSSRSGNRS